MNDPYIHDVGFRSHVLQAIPGILAILKQQGLQEELIVALGCGSGLLTEINALALYCFTEQKTGVRKLTQKYWQNSYHTSIGTGFSVAIAWVESG